MTAPELPPVTDPAAILRRMTDLRGEVLAACRRNGFTDPTVFGSVLRGDVTPRSDVDVAVTDTGVADYYSRLSRLVRLHAELTRLLSIGRDLDLVETTMLKEHVAEAVAREGRPL